MDNTPKKPKKYLHAGHRGRMRQRFAATGLDGFADHEVLEFLLFYALPRQDTNAMAHALIDRFGSLPAVLEASPQDLCAIRGVGPKIAGFLTVIPEVLAQTEYRMQHAQHHYLRSVQDLSLLLERRHAKPRPGDVLLVLMNVYCAVLAVYAYPSLEKLDAREIARRALTLDAKQVALAECVERPGDFLPDRRSWQLVRLQRELHMLDIRLADYYRFGPDGRDPCSGIRSGFLLPL